ncbi:neuropeptide Y receptor Y8a [Paramormyrops kingsleyae]|uniref:neuropeptide Y receptor Y8a n=1 Tax=Paramormyrops kingsleyae TaxID=1676925 RepID=UPI003B96F154
MNTSHTWGEAAWAAGECPPSVGSATFQVAAYSTLLALSLVGNACLMLVIARQWEHHNVTVILIANLCCSDILISVVCLPVTVVYTLMDRWVLGEALCKATPFIQCTSVTVSAFSLVLIALERHQLIVHPTGWMPVAGHTYLAVAIIWTVAGLLSLPFMLFHILTDAPFHNVTLSVGSPGDHLVCMENWPSEQERLTYTTSLLLAQYCLPLLLILLCYLHIYLRLRRRKAGGGPGRGSDRARHINVMLVCIVVAFALCWLPLHVFNTLFDWNDQALRSCQHDAVFSACHLLAMASTCVNPIIYGFLNSNFKKELGAILRRYRRGRQQVLGRRRWEPLESYESVPLPTLSTDVAKPVAAGRGSPRAQDAEMAHCS